MPVEDPGELGRVDREIRINELKHQAEELAGGEMAVFESEDAPPELLEQFWQNVVDHENAPLTSDFEQLTKAGVELPPPETMDDAELHEKLWEVIRALAARRVFLYQTDHLSDRELYTELGEEVLHEAKPDFPDDHPMFGGGSWHIDLLGGCGEEDIYLFHKHYADEKDRAIWAKDWPEDEMPAHVDPPYDRDRLLPQDPMESTEQNGSVEDV